MLRRLMPANRPNLNVANNELPSCAIKLGSTLINLNDVPAHNRIIETNQGPCEFLFANGVLTVSTHAPVDIVISGACPSGVVVATAGKAKIESAEELDFASGLKLKAKSIILNAPINSNASVALDVIDAPNNSITIIKSLKAKILEIKAPKLYTAAPITAELMRAKCKLLHQGARSLFNIGKADAKSVIEAEVAELSGGMTGANVEVTATEKINIKSNITVNGLSLSAPRISSPANVIVDGVDYLKLNGEKLFVRGVYTAKKVEYKFRHLVVLFGGKLRGTEVLVGSALTTMAAFGGRFVAKDFMPNNGLFINLGGIVSAYNFVLDTALPINLGLIIPYVPDMPSNWQEVKEFPRKLSSLPKFFSICKAVAAFLFKPLAILVRSFLKLRTIKNNLIKLFKVLPLVVAYYTGLNLGTPIHNFFKGLNFVLPKSRTAKDLCDWAETYRNKIANNLNNWDAVDLLNGALAIKNIVFAYTFLYDVRAAYAQGSNEELNLPTTAAELKEAVSNNFLPVFSRIATYGFAPCYVEDSVCGIDAGVRIGGYDVITNAEEHSVNRAAVFNIANHL